MKYIDADKLIADIESIINSDHPIEYDLMEKRAYNSALSDVINLITSLQQEQPKVDLEKFTKKIKTFQERYKHPEIVSIKGAMAFMARMFYQYPNVARLWYDRLPKTTMD